MATGAGRGFVKRLRTTISSSSRRDSGSWAGVSCKSAILVKRRRLITKSGTKNECSCPNAFENFYVVFVSLKSIPAVGRRTRNSAAPLFFFFARFISNRFESCSERDSEYIHLFTSERKNNSDRTMNRSKTASQTPPNFRRKIRAAFRFRRLPAKGPIR